MAEKVFEPTHELFKYIFPERNTKILFMLKEERSIIQHISDKLGINKSSVSHELHKMMNAGLIERYKDALNNKNVYWELSELGKHIMDHDRIVFTLNIKEEK